MLVCDQIPVTMMTKTMLFQVGPGDDYMLTVGGFNDALSTLGDSMTVTRDQDVTVNGMRFSTR